MAERGMLPLEPEQLALLKRAMSGHAGGRVSGDPTIGVCWDADRLDLWRVGSLPVVELMSTRAGKEKVRELQPGS
ncbi:MAG: hypothetical protein JXO51_04855 [Candidatus Aminicenantes bacterium]|nr:hypothetical protein [Candidatus Aminicenantes bacterium]